MCMYSTVTPLRKQQIEILRRRFPYILISASGKDDDDVYAHELLKYMYKFRIRSYSLMPILFSILLSSSVHNLCREIFFHHIYGKNKDKR